MITRFRKPLLTVLRLPATLSLIVVRTYQSTLSPDHGLFRHFFPYGFCRHEPTCSAYALETLKTEPFLHACLRIAKRVLSCHPWGNTSDERLKKAVKRALQ